MAGKGAKKSKAKKAEPKRKTSAPHARPQMAPPESLEQLMRQKEEVEALLSSLEDAYSEAAILEEDYNDIKSKNEKKLEDIKKRVYILTKKQAAEPPQMQPSPPARPRVSLPVIEEIEEEETTPAVEEKPKKEKKEKIDAGPSVSQEDLKKLELDLAEKIKDMVEEIGAKVTEKDLLEMKNSFAKYEAEIDKMKAQVEAVKEGKRIDEEKIQRVAEGVAEIRTMVYGREAASKEQEIRTEKVVEVMRRLEPEKIMFELGRRDKEMGNQNLRLTKIEETTKEFGEMLRRIEKLLQNIGSLEHVLTISKEASEKLMSMENINRSNQKMLDKIQGIYAELSKRMEEFVLYRAKQDRMEDLVNEVIKNLDELNTRSAYFVTKDDLESFRASVQSSAAAPYPSAGVAEDTASQKEGIEMLLKTLEDEFRGRTISKGEYEKMKKANLAKLKELEERVEKKSPPPQAPEREIKSAKPAKAEKKPEETKSRNEMLLKDLDDTFKKGFISKEAYEKTRKMIIGKR